MQEVVIESVSLPESAARVKQLRGYLTGQRNVSKAAEIDRVHVENRTLAELHYGPAFTLGTAFQRVRDTVYTFFPIGACINVWYLNEYPRFIPDDALLKVAEAQELGIIATTMGWWDSVLTTKVATFTNYLVLEPRVGFLRYGMKWMESLEPKYEKPRDPWIIGGVLHPKKSQKNNESKRSELFRHDWHLIAYWE